MARPRKPYKPPIPRQRQKLIKLPVIFRYTPERDRELKELPKAYVEAIQQGVAGEHQWITLVYRLYIGMGLIPYLSDESGQQTLLVLVPALQSLYTMGLRYHDTYTFAFEGEELDNVMEALDLVNALQDLTERKQHRDSYQQVSPLIGGFDVTMTNLKQECAKHSIPDPASSPP